MGALWSGLLSVFHTKKLELCLVGLSGSGKSTFARALELGSAAGHEEAPTVGLSVKVMKKKGVTCKIWDMGGQSSYRREWPRYTKGCDVICFVIDTQAPEDLAVAKKELHQLLEDRDLARLPILVLANKIDMRPKIFEKDIIQGLNLDYIIDNPWLVIPVSAKDGTNIDKALEFLIKLSK